MMNLSWKPIDIRLNFRRTEASDNFHPFLTPKNNFRKNNTSPRQSLFFAAERHVLDVVHFLHNAVAAAQEFAGRIL